MQIIKPGVLALIIMTGACASTPGDRGSRDAAKKPLRGGVAEFRVISYDGHELEGRVLLGATVDPLVIDGRLYDWWGVELEKVRECGKKELLDFWSIEPLFFPPPRPDQIITVRPGYWYGGKVNFVLLSNKTKGGIGTECVEADLVVRARGMRVAARLPIRVVRTDKPPATPDGGTEEPKMLPSDAGAP